MLTIEGKYNTASVMIDRIDETTREQIEGFLDCPSFSGGHIAVMPDCHAGIGAVIGFTMELGEEVIPNIIGVDIGCGMLSARFSGREPDLARLDAFIRREIPSGFRINEGVSLQGRLADEVGEEAERIGIEPRKALRAAGSLGGGNHFIEAGRDGEGNFRVTIHSGSRNFGKCVAEFYQRRAREFRARRGSWPWRNLESLPVDSAEGQAYLSALGVAQRFAAANRREMMSRIASFLGRRPEDAIESVHNFIGEDRIIRKGATPAREGETVIIPFNMRDGLAICRGRGNPDYNNSAPHGAGRLLSRHKARESLSLGSFQAQMKAAGIYTTTACAETLDEAPGAYKDTATILENIEATVEVLDLVKPLYNFKAGAD